MTLGLYIAILCGLAVFSYFFGTLKIRRVMASIGAGDVKQHSRDNFHGLYVAAWVFLPALFLVGLWQAGAPFLLNYFLENQVRHFAGDMSAGAFNVLIAKIHAVHAGALDAGQVEGWIGEAAAYYGRLQFFSTLILMGAASLLAAFGFHIGRTHIAPRFAARHRVEAIIRWAMIGASVIAILTTIGIILSLIFEAMRFFKQVPLSEFLFGLQWSPQIAIRADQPAGSGAFGIVPLFAGTFMITLIAILVALPIGLMSAIYLSEYAGRRLRDFAKPAIEILAGIPTVVYGFFAALFVAPLLRDTGANVGLALSSESALAAGLVMGIMIIPMISSLSDDVIAAVPQNLRDGAEALGATKSETIRQVVLPAALPGIVSAVLLAISCAIGETMIVVMAAGVAANLTANPFESVTTVTVQIVMLLIGDQEFDSAKTLAAFALGLVLFVITLGLNILALYIVRKYREQYE